MVKEMSTYTIRYDRYANALYVKIKEGEYEATEPVGRSQEVGVDLDREDNVIGVEIHLPGAVMVPPELEEDYNV